ncbi:MAG TPA: hypothetical protein VFA33_22925 [Bryobacteraceae bacterium]|nr:hypothetical protein [Bryobacteraceae bacterium]
MRINVIVLPLLAAILACSASGQVASVGDPTFQSYALAARGGQHAGFYGGAQPVDQFGVFARSLGAAWDAGAEVRAARLQSGGAWLDFGVTALYGSAGAKAAGEAGVVLGDSFDCFLWAKGMLGNFRAAAGGIQLGRISISGAYGNYFENRADLGVRLDRRGKYTATVGYSSALGFNGGMRRSWSFKR